MPKVTESVEESEKILRGWCEEGMRRVQEGSTQITSGGNIFLMKIPSAENPVKTDEEMEIYRERYEYEFGVLKENNVLDYFVMVGDVVRCGPSLKGSRSVSGAVQRRAVSSATCGITAIDPVSWGLLFERFLNPIARVCRTSISTSSMIGATR